MDLAALDFSAQEQFSLNSEGSGTKPLRNVPNYVIIQKIRILINPAVRTKILAKHTIIVTNLKVKYGPRTGHESPEWE